MTNRNEQQPSRYNKQPDQIEDKETQTKDGQAKGKKSRKKRKRMSICEESDLNLYDTFQTMLRDMNALLEKAKGDGLKDYDEVIEISETIKRTSKKLSKIDIYREENPNKVVKVIPFSSVTLEDLDLLGVQSISIIDEEALDRIITATVAPEVRSGLDRFLPALAQSLENVRRSVSTHSNEAGARMVINQWLLELTVICKPMELSIFLWPELRLSSISNDPVRIDFEDNATFITGIVDYAIAAVDNGFSGLQRTSLWTQIQTIDVIAELSGLRQSFVLLEAKTDDVKLVDYIPQAVLQCLALPSGKRWLGSSSDQVSFCLANTSEWIFGLVNRVNEKQVYYTTTKSSEDSLINILDPLLSWVTTPSQSIYRAMHAHRG